MHAPLTDFPWFVPTIVFVLGACIGSFLNVVIHRLPRDESLVRPRSHCACGQPIAWYDNIPILSWIVLRGKARCCGRRISARYPAVELGTALLFLGCWRIFPPATMACGWVFVSALLCAAFVDLEHLFIPDAFTVGLGVAGLLLSFLVPALHGEFSGYYALDSLRSGTAGLEGLLVGSGVVLWIAVLAGAALRKEAMGMGDVKFVGAIGAFCGWHGAVFSVFGGAVAGALAMLALALFRRPRSKIAFGAQVPFGPMLALAGAAYFLVLRGPVDAWFARLTDLY